MSNSSLKIVFLEKLMCEMKERLGNKIQTIENEISREVVGFNGGLLVSASTYRASGPEFNTAPVQSFDSS